MAAIVTRPRVLTVTEAAAVLRVSRATAYRLVDDEVLPVLRLRGRLKVPREALESAGRELQHWTLDEMRAFLAHIAAFQAGVWSTRDASMWAVDLGTGLRRGELLGLRRRDLDLRNARLHVRQQWTKDGANGRATVTLKTGQKAWRTVDLDQDTVAVLEMQLAMIDTEREQWGKAYLDQGLVFPREGGLPQDPDEVTRRFKRAAMAAPGVPEIVFHGLRHTHATLLLEDGVSLKVVAERLGDREDTVLKLYGHITPRGRVVAVASIGTWWREEGTAGPSAEVTALCATIARLEAELATLREGLPASREQSVSDTPTRSSVEAG